MSGDGWSEGEVSKGADSPGALLAEPLTQREEGRWGGKGVTASKEPAASMQSALAGMWQWSFHYTQVVFRSFQSQPEEKAGTRALLPASLERPGITGSRALALYLLHHTKATVNKAEVTQLTSPATEREKPQDLAPHSLRTIQ